MNNRPVICVTDYRGGCIGVLFTLKPGTDRIEVLRKMFASVLGRGESVEIE